MAKALFLFALASMALFSLAIGQNADSFEPNNEMGDATELESARRSAKHIPGARL